MNDERVKIFYSRAYRLRIAIYDTLLCSRDDESPLVAINQLVRAWKEHLLILDWTSDYRNEEYVVTITSAYLPSEEITIVFPK